MNPITSGTFSFPAILLRSSSPNDSHFSSTSSFQILFGLSPFRARSMTCASTWLEKKELRRRLPATCPTPAPTGPTGSGVKCSPSHRASAMRTRGAQPPELSMRHIIPHCRSTPRIIFGAQLAHLRMMHLAEDCITTVSRPCVWDLSFSHTAAPAAVLGSAAPSPVTV